MLINKKFFFWINLSFVLLLLIGTFLVFPPSGNFGDQPTQNVHFQEKHVEYIESDFQGSFSDYYKDKWRNYHKEKLELKDVQDIQAKYGLDERIPGITDMERVKALSRLLELVTHYITFKLFDMETTFIITSFFIFVGTYFFSYKFGSEIANPIFGTILAVVVTSNVYFNQLIRSAMENQTLLYPFLFLMSFYYLLRLHKTENNKKLTSILGLSLSISLSIINGYPNSTLILVPSIFIFSVVICINNILGNREYQRTTFINYIIVILVASFFTFLFSSIWSKLLGEGIFYYLSIIDVRWRSIFIVGGFSNGTFFDCPSLTTFSATFKNVFHLLFSGCFSYNGPHEPGMLFRQGFFNVFENVLLIIGLSVLATYLFTKKVLNVFFFFLVFNLGVFLARALSNINICVRKDSYDYYFLLQLIVSYGLYYLITHSFAKLNIQKVSNNIYNVIPALIKPKPLNNEHSRIAEKIFLCVSLIIILTANLYRFNKNFVYDQNESLGYHYGLYELRQFIKNEADHDNNLLILDWRWDVFNIDLVTFLSGKFKYDVLVNFKNLFDTPEKMKSALESGTYSTIYIVVPGPIATIEGRHYLTGGRKRYNHLGVNLYDYLSLSNHYLTIKDRQGKPNFYVHKITKETDYQTVKISPSSQSEKISIDLPPNHCLDYIDFPGNVIKAELVCKDQRILIDLSKSPYDYFHFSFDKKSTVEIYNKFDLDKQSVVSMEHILPMASNYYKYLVSQGRKAHIDFKYEFDFPIHEVLYNIPYMLYHNRSRTNKMAVHWKDEAHSRWKTLNEVVSNGTEKFGDWEWSTPSDPFASVDVSMYIDSFAGVIDPNGANQIYLRYSTRTNTYCNNWDVRFITQLHNMPEDTPNILIFNLDTSKFADFSRNCMGKVCINLFYGEPKNLSPSQSFIGVGIRQLANK